MLKWLVSWIVGAGFPAARTVTERGRIRLLRSRITTLSLSTMNKCFGNNKFESLCLVRSSNTGLINSTIQRAFRWYVPYSCLGGLNPLGAIHGNRDPSPIEDGLVQMAHRWRIDGHYDLDLLLINKSPSNSHTSAQIDMCGTFSVTLV